LWGRRFRLPVKIMPDYRRRLPHVHPQDAYLFLTWRLFDSLPQTRPDPRYYATPGHAFVAQDRAWDLSACGPRWLAIPRVADLVASAIQRGDQERGFYQLYAWAVMPNHVHLLIVPHFPVPVLMRWLKGSTARAANGILERTGHPFWQDESFDHYARTPAERDRIIAYIESNPVSAGLVSQPDLWRWSSAGWQAQPPAPQTEPTSP
jgi:REP element-mobilizing transposase RayT